MYILIAILLFGLLILIHELGHYITARIFGVAIYEFSIGMGPKIYSKTSAKTGIVYSLRALPIGGFVSMAGEDEESDNPNAFDKKPVWQRMIITAAGAAFNILLGFLIMIILVANTKVLGTTQVSKFHDGALSPNYGLQIGDIVTEVDGRNVHIPSELSYFISRYGTEPIDITIIRNGEELVLDDVIFAISTDAVSELRFGQCDFYVNIADKNIGTVIKTGFYQSFLTIRIVIDALGDLITGTYGIEDMSGPVGVTGAISSAAKESSANLWTLFVLLAMNLGIMNLLPFPALDGGRIIVLLIELIIRRPVNKKVEAYINLAGMIILFSLMAIITVKDISDLLKITGK